MLVVVLVLAVVHVQTWGGGGRRRFGDGCWRKVGDVPRSQGEAGRGRRKETAVREEAGKGRGGASEMKAAGELCGMARIVLADVGEGGEGGGRKAVVGN